MNVRKIEILQILLKTINNQSEKIVYKSEKTNF